VTALAIGARIGVYEVVALLGAGGMGEVYRARDAKLGRDVAIKVLPASFAADPDRLARLEREARLLASLSHPNIGAIYGVEESGGATALVLELVEGETLRAHIARSPRGLPIAEAVWIARQIADALDAAHERGIVHRDLKPANIVLTPGGTVKVLDFGLAKGSDGPGGRDDSLTHSPTVIGPTAEGMLLGTAPYMSPEQARGKVVDKRADIWAFGCLLYEMLTGRRAFAGDTTTDALAKILEREPDWQALPAATPHAIRRLLERCLQKDPKRRLRDIADARSELDDDSIATPAPKAAPPRRRRTAALLAALAILVGVGVLAGTLWRRAPPVRPRPAQFTFAAPEGERLEMGFDSSRPIPSPDGSRIAFIATSASGTSALWIRSVDAVAAHRLAGTEDAVGPAFWSPDSRFLGFFAQGKLKRIDPSGGPALNIAPIAVNLGATWGADNVIVVAPVNRTVLHRVPASGGTPEPITTLNAERRENSHRWPHFLPDGRHFLFTARSDVKENNLVYVGTIDSKDVKALVAVQSNAVYVSPGYLIYARDATLMAQRFDVAALSLVGEAMPVAASVAHSTASSSAAFGASADGSVLAYRPAITRGSQVAWYDRSGSSGPPLGPERAYTEVRLAPNEKLATVVIADSDSGNRDIWLLELTSGSLTRLTTNPANDWQVAWTPDSRQIAFASDRNGPSSVYRKTIDAVDEELLLRLPGRGAFPKDWSADGRWLTLGIDSGTGLAGIWALSLAGDRTPFPLGRSGVRENHPRLSHDGRLIAFESDESGATEIYVAPFGKTGRRRVSTGGGTQPRWRADGREVFFTTMTGEVMAAAVTGSEPLETAPAVRLFHGCGGSPAVAQATVGQTWFEVAGDGNRFLLACAAGSATSPIVVSVDWTASLK
jgi:serine/threonine protein kinase/Tol biopolymer transport system component